MKHAPGSNRGHVGLKPRAYSTHDHAGEGVAVVSAVVDAQGSCQRAGREGRARVHIREVRGRRRVVPAALVHRRLQGCDKSISRLVRLSRISLYLHYYGIHLKASVFILM